MIALFDINKVHLRKNFLIFNDTLIYKVYGKLQLDFNVYARGKVDGIQKLRVCGIDVDDSLIRSEFELLAGILVFVGTAKDGHDLSLGGKGNGTGDLRSALLHGLYDPLRRLIYQLVLVCG
jgi:hypothetical protein